MMSAWTVGQQVALNRNSIVTIDRVTPSGRAVVGGNQYNPDGSGRQANQLYLWAQKPLRIEVLTPEVLTAIALFQRWKMAADATNRAVDKLTVWSRMQCSSYSPNRMNLAVIEQIERVATAAAAMLPVKAEVAP